MCLYQTCTSGKICQYKETSKRKNGLHLQSGTDVFWRIQTNGIHSLLCPETWLFWQKCKKSRDPSHWWPWPFFLPVPLCRCTVRQLEFVNLRDFSDFSFSLAEKIWSYSSTDLDLILTTLTTEIFYGSDGSYNSDVFDNSC